MITPRTWRKSPSSTSQQRAVACTRCCEGETESREPEGKTRRQQRTDEYPDVGDSS